MKSHKLIWRVFPAFLIIVSLSLLIISYVSTSYLQGVYTEKIMGELDRSAQYLQEKLSKTHLNEKELDSTLTSFSILSKHRVTLILPNGKVLTDTHKNPTQLDNHLFRPEIQAALKEEIGKSVRYSNTLNLKAIYFAKLCTLSEEKGGSVSMIIRVSSPYNEVDVMSHSFYGASIGSGIILALLMALFSYFVTRRIVTPIETLTYSAQRIAQGDFKAVFPSIGTGEVENLAKSMTHMARQLEERFTTIMTERNEKESILRNMLEGVMTINHTGQIISMNAAMEQLLKLKLTDIRGHRFENCMTSDMLIAFVQKSLRSEQPMEADIILTSEHEQVVQARGSALRDSDGKVIGTLLVLNNITRLKKLQRMRKDFVDNVSHELRTPITLIKGFVETLEDGALEEPESAKKFLAIIKTHSERLTQIIEDLLALSRIEQDQEFELETESCFLHTLISRSVRVCELKAEKKEVKLQYFCSDTINITVNAPLLEQAIVNLIDNAIKYSPPQKKVLISVSQSKTEIKISISDEGNGISKEHLPFLFQRFYRVDKARSRDLGGTGLGLSIVKHIALAHRGHVEVESTLNQGSIFSIYLPII